MKKQLIDSLDECINLLQAGYSVEYCLSQYPEHSTELIGLLQSVEYVSELKVDNIPEESNEKSRFKILAKIQRDAKIGSRLEKSSSWMIMLRKIEQGVRGYYRIKPAAGRLALALVIAGILIVASGGLLITSAKSLPGDSLYPVKLAVEDIRIHLASNSNARHAFEDSYTLQRVIEVKRLLNMARSQEISFRGIVNSMNDNRWDISGVPVTVQADTLIVGGMGGTKLIKLGMTVEVEGMTNPEGWVVADEIHIQEYQFIGAVEKITNKYWMISGIRIIIPPTADIDSGIKVGDDVQVYVHSEDSGLFALSIQRDNHPTETPKVHPSPEITLISPGDNYSHSLSEHKTSGILEQINTNYWVINGHIYYIIYTTQFDSEITTGDEVSVKYIIEYNGSYTALEIEKEHDESNDNGGLQETPESSSDKFEELRASQEPTEVEVADEINPTPVYTEESEPSETHQPSETPKSTETPEPTDD